MQKFLTLRDGRKVLLNTPTEEAKINAGIAADPDTYLPSDSELAQLKPVRGRPPLVVKRTMVSMRLDPDVLEGLRATGAGWQTRVNAILREAVHLGKI